jgi:hypothetical protein
MRTYSGIPVPEVLKYKLTNRIWIDRNMREHSNIDIDMYVRRDMIRQLAEHIEKEGKLCKVNMVKKLEEKNKLEPLDKHEQRILGDYYNKGKELHEASVYVFTEKELMNFLSVFESQLLRREEPIEFKREILGTWVWNNEKNKGNDED